MDPFQLAFVAACGLLCSFFAGLMGIGGGVLMAPLILVGPSVFHISPFPIAIVSGLAVTQDMAGSFSAAVAHRRFHFQSRDLLIRMCTCMFVGAFTGAILSHYARGETILTVLAILVTLGAVCMLKLDLKTEEHATAPASNRPVFIAVVAGLVGLLAGFVGQGAGFLLLPAMLVVLRIPLRVTIANSLAIIFCAALGGVLGRWDTRQISGTWLLVLLITAAPGTALGSYVNHRIRHKHLGQAMIALLFLASLQLWIKVFAL